MAASYLTTDWAAYSKINRELESLLPALGGFQLVTPNTTIHSLRALGANRRPSELWPDVLEKNIQIPMSDGAFNRARIYSPRNVPTEGSPLLVIAYGGGWIAGHLEQEEMNCRTWAKSFGGVAVSIDYRHCPEHDFQVPHNDMFDAVKWVAANYRSLNADPGKGFIIGGVSSGATTMIAISHLWRDESLQPPLTGLYLSIPSPCVVSALPEKYKAKDHSWEQNKDAPIHNRASSNFTRDHCKVDPHSPLRSPLLFPTGHKNLPPAYFIIAGMDPWRDVGLIYEGVLREECGIKTKVDVFPGLCHGFWALFPKSEFSKDHREKSEEGLKWLLENSS